MENEVSPEELLARIAAGCKDAFSKLYDDFSAALFGITLGILKNHAEAEETLQDLFVSIWEKASRYDSQHGKATTWLITMARNRAIDRLRSRQRREKLHASAHHETFLDPPTQESPDRPLIAAERAIRVRRIAPRLCGSCTQSSTNTNGTAFWATIAIRSSSSSDGTACSTACTWRFSRACFGWLPWEGVNRGFMPEILKPARTPRRAILKPEQGNASWVVVDQGAYEGCHPRIVRRRGRSLREWSRSGNRFLPATT